MDTKKGGYIKKEVAELLGVRPSLVQYYTDRGVIKPEVDAPTGRGTRRRYSRWNLFEILLTQRLVEHGLSLDDVKNPIGNPLRMLRSHREGFLRARVRREPGTSFWKLTGWDSSHIVFLTVRYEGGYFSEILIDFVHIGEEKKIERSIRAGTQYLILIDISDIVQRIAQEG